MRSVYLSTGGDAAAAAAAGNNVRGIGKVYLRTGHEGPGGE
jgi:hypothetical protein